MSLDDPESLVYDDTMTRCSSSGGMRLLASRLKNGTYRTSTHPLHQTDTILYIRTKIVVLYHPDLPDSKVPETHIQSNHDIVNAALNQRFENSDTKFPLNARYTAKMVSARIQHLPRVKENLSEERGLIEYVEIDDKTVTSCLLAEQTYLQKGGTLDPKTFYVYICPLVHAGATDKVLMGNAKSLGYNNTTPSIALNYLGVGGINNPGPVGAKYGSGMTWMHELGHALGLFHPFPSRNEFNEPVPCDDPSVKLLGELYPELPPQINPNVFTSLEDAVENLNGLDNRGRDLLRYQGRTAKGLKPGDAVNAAYYSCATEDELVDGAPFEHPGFFMDYGDDETMTGVITSARDIMRATLLNHAEAFGLELRDGSTVSTAEPDNASGELVLIIFCVLIILLLGLFVWIFIDARGPKRFDKWFPPTRG